MDLQSVLAKHEQRLLVVFTGPLGSGAFGVNPTAYVVENLDGRSPDPVIRAALIVPGDANVVELALSSPMAVGASFRLTATSVPAYPSGTATGVTEFRYAAPMSKRNREPAATAAEVFLYGSDLCWNGIDFQETATGDLEVVEGVANVSKALLRVCLSGPLPWDNAYGAHARDYVDSPTGAAGSLRGTIAAKCARDPRVSKIAVRALIDEATTKFDITPSLISGAPVEPITVKVQNA